MVSLRAIAIVFLGGSLFLSPGCDPSSSVGSSKTLESPPPPQDPRGPSLPQPVPPAPVDPNDPNSGGGSPPSPPPPGAPPGPVPEPGTILLVGSGLAGLAVYARRRREGAKGAEKTESQG